MGIKKRRGYADYLDVSKTGSENYVLMGAGFVDLNESPSAQTASKKYINDKNSTKTIIGYDWSTAYNTDMIRDELAVDFICNIGENQLIGSDAETNYVKVDLDKPLGGNNYVARKFRVAIEVSSFDNNDGDMSVSGNLLGQGDIVQGTFNTVTKSFTVSTIAPSGTLTVTSTASSTTSGKTVISVTPTKTAGNSYKYITGASVTIPALNDICNAAYITWDGTSEISAITNNKILIVEVDANNRCQKAGVATVTAKV